MDKMRGYTRIMDAEKMDSALRRLAHQILDSSGGAEGLALVGIRTRGASVAKSIAGAIERITGSKVAAGALDVTPYRDDVKETGGAGKTGAGVDFDIDGKKIILADDVLYTGRTARAAMDALMDMGRPSFIKLAVLVDRGHRELPIKADFVGKNVPTAPDEKIAVRVMEFDGEEGVFIVGPDAV